MQEPVTLGSFGKSINATIILVLGVFVTALADGTISSVEWLMAAVALLRGVRAFGVRPEWGRVGVYLPLILTAVIGGLTQLVTVLHQGTGISYVEILSAVIVFLTALGSTVSTSNASLSDALRSDSGHAA